MFKVGFVNSKLINRTCQVQTVRKKQRPVLKISAGRCDNVISKSKLLVLQTAVRLDPVCSKLGYVAHIHRAALIKIEIVTPARTAAGIVLVV